MIGMRRDMLLGSLGIWILIGVGWLLYRAGAMVLHLFTG